MKRPLTANEAQLAGAIAQALIARGDFAAGAFDKILPDGGMDADEVRYDSAAVRGLIAITTISLMAARMSIDTLENLPPSGKIE